MSDESFKFHDLSARLSDQRRHPRHRVFKTALLHPVIEEASLAVENVSRSGLSGQSALTLGLGQLVHVGFDDATFHTAEVRWIKGRRCGLMLEEPLLWIEGEEPAAESSPELEPRDYRMPVVMSAMLLASAPVMVGTIRNMSAEGMMIETNCQLSEGTRLLVKTRGSDVHLGRVQWSSGGMCGVFFEALARANEPHRNEKK